MAHVTAHDVIISGNNVAAEGSARQAILLQKGGHGELKAVHTFAHETDK